MIGIAAGGASNNQRNNSAPPDDGWDDGSRGRADTVKVWLWIAVFVLPGKISVVQPGGD